MTQSRTITIGQFMREAIEARLAIINVSLPCKVLKYDKAKNTVNLQPLLKRKRRKKDGTTIATEIPSLQNVPVAFQRCAAGWMTLPLAAGDIGQVVFAQRSLAEWMGKSKGEVVEPSDEEMFPLAGAWFYPGGYPSASPLDADDQNVVIHTETNLLLGDKTASEFVALATKTKTELDKVKTYLQAMATVWSIPIPEAGMGAPSSFATAMQAAAPLANVPNFVEPAASKVKAK